MNIKYFIDFINFKLEIWWKLKHRCKMAASSFMQVVLIQKRWQIYLKFEFQQIQIFEPLYPCKLIS